MGSNIAERLARLEEQVSGVREDVAEVLSRIDGPPWERSLRGRMHTIEAESAAATVAAKTLAEVQHERRQAQLDRKRAEDARWNWRWKALGALTAIAVACAPYVAIWKGH